jgi:ABC-type transport system involved in Fe-S cluster assembly fused permease/ATPase subunit
MRAARNQPDSSWSGDWKVVGKLIPYLLEFPARVAAAMAFLVLAKVANVVVPLVLKYLVDGLSEDTAQLVAVPVSLVLAYGILRFSTTLFGELRDAVFSRVAERGMRRIGLEVFTHMHNLDLGFHLSRKTGGVSRDIERGTSGISFLLRFMLFNILPTLFELLLILGILLYNFSIGFTLITLAAVALYIFFSVMVTEWRLRYVREANQKDSQSNTRAIDSLLNYETVKYFGNEAYEAELYDDQLADWEQARLKNRYSLFALNVGQAVIIGVALTAMMWLAAQQVVNEQMTIGDLVMINAYMIQLFVPLNFLGFVYREIKNSMANIERMFDLLETETQIQDSPRAGNLVKRGGEVSFENVSFSYREDRPILKDISFSIPAGQKTAIVGPSGSGKSTIARLLFRFYDPDQGRILIDGQPIAGLTQSSVRAAIGVVPQDTVLFNASIAFNIGYGKSGSSQEEIEQVARTAHLEAFIKKLPDGYETEVGERGLKLSGGEKQRIAIARTLLKAPEIMVFDEATSSLDSGSEKAILAALREASENHTTLAIAHRLSTIVDADQILVLQDGEIVERGNHEELLGRGGLYANLWRHQQQEQQKGDSLEPAPA